MSDKFAEDRVSLVRTALEFGVELNRKEEIVLRKLNFLYKARVRR